MDGNGGCWDDEITSDSGSFPHSLLSTSKIDFINESMVSWFTCRNVGLWYDEITGIAGNLGLWAWSHRTFAPLRQTKRDGEVNVPKRSRAHAHVWNTICKRSPKFLDIPKLVYNF